MSKWGYVLKKKGMRYYIAETFAGIRVSGFERISVARVNDLVRNYDLECISNVTIALNAKR